MNRRGAEFLIGFLALALVAFMVPLLSMAQQKTDPPAETKATRVDINTADAKQLQTLPGVGPVIAERIIAYRDEHGPFKSVDELIEVKGIGPKRLESIRDMVVVE